MRKLLILALISMVVLAGCNSGPNPNEMEENRTLDPGKNRSVDGQDKDGNISTDNREGNEGDKTTKKDSEGDQDKREDDHRNDDQKEKNDDNSEDKESEEDQNEEKKYNIAVEGELGINVNEIFGRIVSLTKADLPGELTIKVKNTQFLDRFSGILRIRNTFADYMIDAKTKNERATGPIGLYSSNTIYIAKANKTYPRLESTLVHEYVHHIQLTGRELWGENNPLSYEDYEDDRIRRGLIEGGAVYVTDQYIEKYMVERQLQSTRLKETYNSSSAVGKYVRAPYRFGRRYFEMRIDSIEEHWKVYKNPPNTTEQLIHGYRKDEETPKNISVEVNLSNSSYSTDSKKRMGELLIRMVLTSELNESMAAEGAAGWGNDRLISVRKSYQKCCYAWVVKWDNKEEANEFTKTFEKYLKSRGKKNGSLWFDDGSSLDIKEVNKDTVIVLVGPKKFINNTNAESGQSEIEISVSD